MSSIKIAEYHLWEANHQEIVGVLIVQDHRSDHHAAATEKMNPNENGEFVNAALAVPDPAVRKVLKRKSVR